MQTWEEAPRYGLKECVSLALTDEHPLAVGGDHICPVSEHPVKAATACDYILASGLVDDVYHIVASSCGEGVLRCGGFEFATHHEVVTVPAYQVVGAKAALNPVVTVPANQVL